ncbi:hypothetical protein ACHAXA_011831 [Cyclostephanos tholiformis]|uniref:PH domain-containing protein n=1 Tax=Cyclostephanos tholiformis TaxID=382380 RepID=A0ABD3RWH0_9STRA
MSGELRRRMGGTTSPSPSPPSSSSTRGAMADGMDYDESNLSASALLSASPVHSSSVWKLHVPAFYALLPSHVRWMLSCRCCPSGWGPRWKRRRLIALGGYLYRFEDYDEDDGRGGGGDPPKGAPVPVTTVDARVVVLDRENDDDDDDDDDDDVWGSGDLAKILPGGCRAIFEVSSSGKTHRFAVETMEEATIWVTSLRQMRQDAITRGMGHSAGVPYPPRWESFDMSARRLVDKKTRIKRRLEAMDKREIEMQIVGGGGMSTGYYS